MQRSSGDLAIAFQEKHNFPLPHPLKLADEDSDEIANGDRLNALKVAGVPAPLDRGRIAGEAARKLFYRLVKECCNENL